MDEQVAVRFERLERLLEQVLTAQQQTNDRLQGLEEGQMAMIARIDIIKEAVDSLDGRQVRMESELQAFRKESGEQRAKTGRHLGQHDRMLLAFDRRIEALEEAKAQS